jgi:hypothetical protein
MPPKTRTSHRKRRLMTKPHSEFTQLLAAELAENQVESEIIRAFDTE